LKDKKEDGRLMAVCPFSGFKEENPIKGIERKYYADELRRRGSRFKEENPIKGIESNWESP